MRKRDRLTANSEMLFFVFLNNFFRKIVLAERARATINISTQTELYLQARIYFKHFLGARSPCAYQMPFSPQIHRAISASARSTSPQESKLLRFFAPRSRRLASEFFIKLRRTPIRPRIYPREIESRGLRSCRANH